MQLYPPASLVKGSLGVFMDVLSGMEAKSLVPILASVIDSKASSETYAWLAESPQMEQITDEIEFSALTDTSYTITNQLFAAGLAIKRSDLADDQVGSIQKRIQQLAAVAAAYKNKLLMNLLINGTTDLAYDGVAFFSDSHTARGSSGTIDNLLAGTGTTTAQVSTDFGSALAAMGKVLAENGEPFHEDISEVAIVAPVSIRKPVLEAVHATEIVTTSNVQMRGLKVHTIFNARLDADDVNDWYLLNVGMPTRPLLIQDREPLEFTFQTEGDVAFTREQYWAKARWRGNSGYGHFQGAFKVVNS